MMESDTLVDNVTIKQQQSQILHDIKGQYMKESNTLADNAAINILQRDIWLNTLTLIARIFDTFM